VIAIGAIPIVQDDRMVKARIAFEDCSQSIGPVAQCRSTEKILIETLVLCQETSLEEIMIFIIEASGNVISQIWPSLFSIPVMVLS
jgi:hypothetical protein